ncbi:MAG: hypothetical protein KF746_02105 [Chitinophagaceae bacterium]|nr:hypothetical protein [Chitinophagaceae bacterium]
MELGTNVSESLGLYESAVKKQRTTIINEQVKVDLYVSNFKSNLFSISKYLEENCKEEDQIKKLLKEELAKTKKMN